MSPVWMFWIKQKMNPIYAAFYKSALCDGYLGLKLELQVQLKSTVSSRALKEVHFCWAQVWPKAWM